MPLRTREPERFESLMETQPTSATSVPAFPLPPSISIDARYWFAISIRSHHEKKVARYLAERQIEHFLPMYRTVHRWTNYRKAVLELPLFPGYLFIRIAPRERIRALELPGVLSLIGCGSNPLPIPAREVESLRSGLHLRCFEPHACLVNGARARIIAGPLAGMEGVVLRKNNSLRVVLTVQMIMQSVAVEVGADELESLNPALPTA
jgi:transcription antitermination factor NusG